MRLTRLDELGARPSTYLARMRVEQLIDLPRLFAVIDADPALIGAGVVYIDAQYNIVNLRRFQAVCSVVPKWLVIQEVRQPVTARAYVENIQRDAREPEMFAEIANMGLACTGAALSVLIIVAGGVTSTFSGGVATPIVYLGFAGAGAALLQCAVGVGRVYSELGGATQDDAWFHEEWFEIVSQLLDTIALLAVGVAGANMIRYLQVRKSSTGIGWSQLLRPLSRQQRKALNDELLRVRHPSLTNKQLKLAQRIGRKKKRLTPAELSQATLAMIRESLASGLTVIGSSSVQSIAVSIMESTHRDAD
ncbi:MAG: NAD synthetase [Pseudomonas putida]|nr:NAD synthetase [Pseudomonas putida]